MPRNTLNDLNDHLFEQIERLNDDELSPEDIKKEASRAQAITKVASQIIKNAKVTIDAMKLVDGRWEKSDLPKTLGVGKHEH
jgi:hypothetical protein